jgi:hypothetical protein
MPLTPTRFGRERRCQPRWTRHAAAAKEVEEEEEEEEEEGEER